MVKSLMAISLSLITILSGAVRIQRAPAVHHWEVGQPHQLPPGPHLLQQTRPPALRVLPAAPGQTDQGNRGIWRVCRGGLRVKVTIYFLLSNVARIISAEVGRCVKGEVVREWCDVTVLQLEYFYQSIFLRNKYCKFPHRTIIIQLSRITV